jgi:hypothetical protein
MVFDVTAAPRNREEFLNWFKEQSESRESIDSNDPESPVPLLRHWFREIIKTFPPMNGPLATDDHDSPRVTDYELRPSFIVALFAWSEAKAAYKAVKESAAKHSVGFYDLSGKEGDIWFPVPGWKLSCEARGEIPLPLDFNFGPVMNKLDSKKNSFFVLENENHNYLQCGGSADFCTVELRVFDGPKKYRHSVVGHVGGSTDAAYAKMSGGVVKLQEGEIFSSAEAAELFDLFFAGKGFPKRYRLRQKDI